jgi:hypothetical protein
VAAWDVVGYLLMASVVVGLALVAGGVVRLCRYRTAAFGLAFTALGSAGWVAVWALCMNGVLDC